MANEEIRLSRVGKQPVELPKGVEATITGKTVVVKGPKGTLNRTLPEEVSLSLEDGKILIQIETGGRIHRAKQGMSRALIQNMVVGVSAGFKRILEVNGVGYRADLKGGRHILFQLGYSHPILFELPEGVDAEISRDNKITLTAIDKEVLGHAAAKVRSFRPPEPYKGKGIKYADETIKRKAGKAAAR